MARSLSGTVDQCRTSRGSRARSDFDSKQLRHVCGLCVIKTGDAGDSSLAVVLMCSSGSMFAFRSPIFQSTRRPTLFIRPHTVDYSCHTDHGVNSLDFAGKLTQFLLRWARHVLVPAGTQRRQCPMTQLMPCESADFAGRGCMVTDARKCRAVAVQRSKNAENCD